MRKKLRVKQKLSNDNIADTLILTFLACLEQVFSASADQTVKIWRYTPTDTASADATDGGDDEERNVELERTMTLATARTGSSDGEISTSLPVIDHKDSRQADNSTSSRRLTYSVDEDSVSSPLLRNPAGGSQSHDKNTDRRLTFTVPVPEAPEGVGYGSDEQTDII